MILLLPTIQNSSYYNKLQLMQNKENEGIGVIFFRLPVLYMYI